MSKKREAFIGGIKDKKSAMKRMVQTNVGMGTEKVRDANGISRRAPRTEKNRYDRKKSATAGAPCYIKPH